MAIGDILLVLVSGLGVMHGLFLAIFLWLFPKGNRLSNQLLAVLLMVLSFRVGKSVLLEFSPELNIKLVFVGLGAMTAIGPLFYLFVEALTTKRARLSIKHGLHFVLTLLGIAFGLWLEKEHTETLPLAVFAGLFLVYYLHYVIYLVAGITKMRRVKASLDQATQTLIRLVFLALLLIWFVYVLNLFDEQVPYIIGPVLYSVVAYVISFFIISKGLIAEAGKVKYQSTHVSDEQHLRLYAKIKEVILDKAGYKNPDLTLKLISEELNISTQIISMIINQESGENFNAYVNKHRVNDAIDILKSDTAENRTVASIAFDVGFNSLSSFNKAFKNQTGQTPSAYRNTLTK